MSDQLPVLPDQPSASAAPTAGSLLRQAREAAGLHVAALAVSMKVPVKKLEALEADRLDLLPDAVFVRALASSVCRTLKLDPTPVLDLLPQTLAPRLGVQEHGINTPFRSSGEARSYSLPELLRKPVVLAVGALLVSALVVLFFPESTEPVTAAGPPVESVLPPPEQAPPLSPSPALASIENPVASSPPLPVEAAAQTSVNVSGVATEPVAIAAVTPIAAASSGVLVLRSRGEAWVEVVDAKGTVQVRKILGQGESAAVSGPLPLSVVIGRADATDVEVRGKPFSLEKISKENVARFEVK